MRWARDSILFLDRTIDVTGQKVNRTTRGTAVFAAEETGPATQTIGNLDQAVYADGQGISILDDSGTPTGHTNNRKQVYAVRGGYAFKLSATGQIQKSNRFVVPCFGYSSICYDPVHDKVICSFYNEQRANDGGALFSVPVAPLVKGLYRLDPDTLELVNYAAPFPHSVGNEDTEEWAGPRRIVSANVSGTWRFFGEYFGSAVGPAQGALLYEFNSVTLLYSQFIHGFGFGGGSEVPSSPWIDLAVDADAGLLRATSSSDTVIQWVDLATFTSLGHSSTNPITTSPGAGSLGTITFDPVDTQNNFGTYPPGYYLVNYKAGMLQFDPFGVAEYFVHLNLGPFRSDVGTLPATSVRKTLNGVAGAGTACGSGAPFGSQTDAQTDANNFATSSIDTFGAGSNLFSLTPHGYAKFVWNSSTAYVLGDTVLKSGFIYYCLAPNTNQDPATPSLYWSSAIYKVINQFQFELVQLFTYNGSPSQIDEPYGLCIVPAIGDVPKKVYVVCGTRWLLSYDPASTAFIRIDLGSDDVTPYNVKYDVDSGYLFVPGYKSNSVLILNPTTNEIVETRAGFDSPFDVVFAGSRALAVQQGLAGLKAIAKPGVDATP